MRAIALGAAIAFAASSALAAPDGQAVGSVVQRYARAITSADPAPSAALCAGNSTVVDEFAPHLWRGAGCAGWVRSFLAMTRREGIGSCTAAVGAPANLTVSGSAAYAVYPATVTCIKRGRPLVDHGLWTFVLERAGAGWKIASWTWSAQQ